MSAIRFIEDYHSVQELVSDMQNEEMLVLVSKKVLRDEHLMCLWQNHLLLSMNAVEMLIYGLIL